MANKKKHGMQLNLVIQQINDQTGDVDMINISSLVNNIVYENQISDQPGKLTFDCIDDNKLFITEGSIVSLQVDNVNVFYGYVFTVSF